MSLAKPLSSWGRGVLWGFWSGNPPLLLISYAPGYCRSWDLNKICYKSGVPLIENGMIERVSVLRGSRGRTFSVAWEDSETEQAPQPAICPLKSKEGDCRGHPTKVVGQD